MVASSLPFFKSDKTKYIHRGEIIEIWRWETAAAAACHRAIPVYRTTETAGGSAVYADFKRALMMMIIMALKVLRLNFCSPRCLFTPISSCLKFLIFMWWIFHRKVGRYISGNIRIRKCSFVIIFRALWCISIYNLKDHFKISSVAAKPCFSGLVILHNGLLIVKYSAILLRLYVLDFFQKTFLF